MTQEFREFIYKHRVFINEHRSWWNLDTDADVVCTAMADSYSVENVSPEMMFCEFVNGDAFKYNGKVDDVVLDFILSADPEHADRLKDMWEDDEYTWEDWMNYIDNNYGAEGVADYCLEHNMDYDWAEDLLTEDVLEYDSDEHFELEENLKKKYDTDTSERIRWSDNDLPCNDGRYEYVALYKSEDGEYFVYGKGGGLSLFREERNDYGRYTILGEHIWEISEEEAEQLTATDKDGNYIYDWDDFFNAIIVSYSNFKEQIRR